VSDMLDGMARIVDVLFNGRQAEPLRKKPPVTIGEIVRRGVSFVSYRGKLYRVKAELVDISKVAK
jgi:hypothetical protein